jgi:hypothetical protein
LADELDGRLKNFVRVKSRRLEANAQDRGMFDNKARSSMIALALG